MSNWTCWGWGCAVFSTWICSCLLLCSLYSCALANFLLGNTRTVNISYGKYRPKIKVKSSSGELIAFSCLCLQLNCYFSRAPCKRKAGANSSSWELGTFAVRILCVLDGRCFCDSLSQLNTAPCRYCEDTLKIMMYLNIYAAGHLSTFKANRSARVGDSKQWFFPVFFFPAFTHN